MLTGLPFQREYEAYMEKWASLAPEIDANIEKYRKADLRITVCDRNGRSLPNARVSIRQKDHAFDFGCNALMLGSLPEAQEKAYEEGITRLFNLITTTLCWSVTEYEKGKFRFGDGVVEMFRRPPIARMIAFAKANGLRIKGQPLMADGWTPVWASHDPDELRRQLASFFQKAAAYLGDRLDIIDVHNEAFLVKGRTPDYPLLDDECSFVDWAFETVKGLFPDCVDLELNEATPINDEPECTDRYVQLARRLIDKKLPVRSLGIQFHMFNQDEVMRHLRGEYLEQTVIDAAYKRFCELDLPLYISEVTIPSNFPCSKEQGEALQAEIARNLYRLWFSVPKMRGIIYWNLKDGPAWKNEGDCRGCLLDQEGSEKPSYQALYQLIRREWMTREVLNTDGNGQISLRGFKGRYEITAEAGDCTDTAVFSLSGDGQQLTLRLDTEA